MKYVITSLIVSLLLFLAWGIVSFVEYLSKMLTVKQFVTVSATAVCAIFLWRSVYKLVNKWFDETQQGGEL